MRNALNFLERSQDVESRIVEQFLDYQEEIANIQRKKHLPPAALIKLRDKGVLYDDYRFMYCHRSYHRFDADSSLTRTQLSNILVVYGLAIVVS